MLRTVLTACALGAAATGAGASDAPAPPKDAAKLAGAADRELRQGNTDASLKLFAESLAARPDAKTYYARHKAWLKKGKLPAAIADLGAAVGLDPSYAMAYLQRGNLHLNTGRCLEAVQDYERTLALDAGKRDAQVRLPQARGCADAMARAADASARGDHHGAVAALNDALAGEQVVQAPALLLARAQAHLATGALEQALGDAAKVLKLEPNNPPAYALRGHALYLHGDYATARAHFTECTRYDPDHRDCREGYKLVKAVLAAQARGDAAAAEGRWADAAEAFTAGAALDGGNGAWQGEVRPKIAKAWVKAKAYDAGRAAAEACLSLLGDGHAECHMWLGEALLAQGAYEEAVRHGRRAHELDRGNGEFAGFAQRAEAALKQSKQKDYYKTLGVGRDVDEGELKKAYRSLAKQLHPDRIQDESQRKEAENQFREVAEAYEVLSDPEKKARYDRGEDVTGNQQQGPPGGGHPFFHFGGGHPFFQGGPGGGGGQQYSFRFG